MSEASNERIREVFESVGLYKPFKCSHCEERDIFVSGPHSHECSICGGRASYGWYTTPLCSECWKRERPAA